MASTIISRFIQSRADHRSVYQAMRDMEENEPDVEENAGMAPLDDGWQEHHVPRPYRDAEPSESSRAGETRPTGDDDVPPYLLVENDGLVSPAESRHPRPGSEEPSLVTSPAAKQGSNPVHLRWQTSQQQQALFDQRHAGKATDGARPPNFKSNPLLAVDAKEKAMWRWVNVQNLDIFLHEVYSYYLGHGVWSIILSRVLNLTTVAFVIIFTYFLSFCVNYSILSSSHKLEEILIPHCVANMSGFWFFTIAVLVVVWLARVLLFLQEIPRLFQMHDFFHYLLDIPDRDIQAVSWQDVVKGLMSLRNLNPSTAAAISKTQRHFMGNYSKERMDAHDIANRLMRRDNYLIALFNRDVLHLNLPIPYLRTRNIFSKTLEWNLSFCILDYAFDKNGQVRPIFLKDSQRKLLSDGFRRRCIIMGFVNVIFAPFIVLYFLIVYFFVYFTEYRTNPGAISSRQFSPFAEWKFREFNELWHLFERRINMANPLAARYYGQFPKDKTNQVARFVAFIAGALVSVLVLATFLDPDIFLGFEITKDRTVLFWIGSFSAVWVGARGMIPEENLVFDPEFALSAVIEYTHYLPKTWNGRLHTDEVRQEFATLYQMKIMIFLEEILSIVTTPFILWFTLPECSDKIIDFFREFTVHVDGLGHVCSFGVFEFQKGGNMLPQSSRQKAIDDPRGTYYNAKDGKMLASYYNFVDQYATNGRGEPLHGRKHFHPPPTFPGVSASHVEEFLTRNQAGKMPPHQTSRDTTAKNARRREAPVVKSMLLDPRHHPNTSGFAGGRLPRTNTNKSQKQPEQASGSKTRDNDLEEEDEGENREPLPDDDSELDGSWKVAAAANSGRETLNEELDNDRSINKGPGVLGLVYQFSKAQTEGKGGGGIGI